MTTSHPEVRLYGDPVLRRQAASVTATAATTGRLLDRLWNVLDDPEINGVGLAAPQIGTAVRVLVARDPERKERGGVSSSSIPSSRRFSATGCPSRRVVCPSRGFS